jgi:hypothetical protein
MEKTASIGRAPRRCALSGGMRSREVLRIQLGKVGKSGLHDGVAMAARTPLTGKKGIVTADA